MNNYLFRIELSGYGDNPDEGWNDACKGFSMDPGSTPEEYDEIWEDGQEFHIRGDYLAPDSNSMKAIFDSIVENVFALYEDDGYDAQKGEIFPQDSRTFKQSGLLLFTSHKEYKKFLKKMKKNPSRRKNPRVTRAFTTCQSLLATGEFEAAALMTEETNGKS